MMKKIISFVLTIFMLVLMLASFSVTAFADASTPLTVVSKNADTDEINIIFSESVAALDTAKAYVSLKKEGIPVEITVSNTYSSSGTTATPAAQTLVIRPASGPVNQIELDTEYTLTIAKGLTNADGSKTLSEDIVWEFRVREILRDDFENGSTDKWTAGNGNTNISIVNTGALSGNGSLAFTSTNSNRAYITPNAEYMPVSSSEYTVKIDYKTNVSGYFAFYSDHITGTNNSFYLAPNGYAQIYATPYSNGTKLETTAAGQKCSGGQKQKISLKDGVVRTYWFWNDTQWLRGYEYYGTSLKGGMMSLATDSGKTMYIDNVQITEVVDVLPDLDVIYKNADADEISLVFEKDITDSYANIASYFSLKKDGVPVDISGDITYTAKGTTGTTRNQGVVIWPSEGGNGKMELGAVYTLTIKKGLTSTDGTLSLNDDVVWVFRVDEILRDDFESGSTDKWTAGNGNTNISIVNTGALSGNGSLAFTSTTGNRAYIKPNSQYMPEDLTEYTVKIDYSKNVPGYFAFYSDHITGVNNSFYLAPNGYAQIYASPYSNGTKLEATIDGQKCDGGQKQKISLKDGIARTHWLWNDTRWLRGYEYYGTSLKGGMISLSVDSGKTMIIDNILVTKCVDITDIYATDMELTLKNSLGASVDNFALASTVSVDMYVANGTDSAKDIVVIYALYKGENEFVKAHKCEKLSLDAGESAVFALPEVATEGATKIKVFVWDNLTDLTPYDICQQFPTN